MYLTSINGLHKDIATTEFYLTRRPKAKKVLIDKANWFIQSIINHQKHHKEFEKFQPVPLNSVILKNMLGCKDYQTIINILVDLEYIKVNHNYTSTAFINYCNSQRKAEGKQPLTNVKPESKKYGITKKAFNEGITPVGVLTSNMRIKIRKYKVEKFNKYYKDEQVHRKIINSLMQLDFNPQNPNALEALHAEGMSNNKKRFYEDIYNDLQELKNLKELDDYARCDFMYYTQSTNVDRVFHYFSNIPKAYRKSLTLKGGAQLAEIDLRNSQPLIIAMNYIMTKEIKFDTSDHMLFEDVVLGNLYSRLKDEALKNNDKELYELYSIDYNKFKAKVLGDGLYFNYVPLHKIRPMEKYLIDLYPSFMKQVRGLKLKNGYKSISHEAQKIESSIFITRLFSQLEPGDIAIPVHDSIIVEEDKVDYYVEKLIKIIKEKFSILDEYYIKKLLRVTYY